MEGASRSPAVRAFHSALHAVSAGGRADVADPRAPEVELTEWTCERDREERAWLDAPDAEGVRFSLRLNDGPPLRASLGRAPLAGDLWEVQCTAPEVRAPAEAGDRVRVHIEATARDGALRQTLVRGSLRAPAELSFMGAPGALVPLEVDAEGRVRSHMFLHVLDVQGRGRTVVGVAAWVRI